MDVDASVHAHLKALKERNAKKVHKLRSPAARKKKWAVNGGSVHIKGIDDGADHRLLPKCVHCTTPSTAGVEAAELNAALAAYDDGLDSSNAQVSVGSQQSAARRELGDYQVHTNVTGQEETRGEKDPVEAKREDGAQHSIEDEGATPDGETLEATRPVVWLLPPPTYGDEAEAEKPNSQKALPRWFKA